MKYRTLPSVYFDGENMSVFNPNDYNFRILDSIKTRIEEKCTEDVTIYEWHHFCKVYGLKHRQLTLNF